MSKMAYKFGISKEEAYILGYIHDIGYIKGREGHPSAGAESLRTCGFNEDFVNAIKYHGSKPEDIPEEYITPYLLCLWDGDCSVDTIGNDVGYRKRLRDIQKRYGLHSIADETMRSQIKYVKEYLGFN